MISKDKEQIQGYVYKTVKAAAQEVAAAQGLSLSSWLQVTIMEAVDEHRQKQARKAAKAGYDGRALL